MHLYFNNESPKPDGELFTNNEQVHSYKTRHRFNPRSTKAKLNNTSESHSVWGLNRSNLSPDSPKHKYINIFLKA